MTNIHDNDIILSGYNKIFLVVFVISICLFIGIKYNNWFQALLILNMSLHYRDFIDFFTDFSDETLIHKTKNNKNNNILIEDYSDNIKTLDNNKMPSNINISDKYNNYINELYGNNIDQYLKYKIYSNPNIKKENIIEETAISSNPDSLSELNKKKLIDNENIIIEKFYNQLYSKYENNINQNQNRKDNSDNVTNLNHFDSISKLQYDRDQMYFNRYLEPYSNDDIKIMSSYEFNQNIPWWEMGFN